MKQTVTVHKATASNGWGRGGTAEPITLMARVSEQTKTVVNNLGQEAVSSMSIYLDKQPNITYDDTIEYTNELGIKIKRKPIAIRPVRMLNARVVLTEVNV